MPTLDVSDALNSPEFNDRFNVVRRQEIVDTHGRSTLTETTYPNVIGVVTSGSPNDLDRPSDYESFTRSISVVTKFKLRGEVAGYQPDVIIWHGSQFVVKAIDLYPQFGPGFYQVECESMERTDTAIGETTLNSLAFNTSKNAAYAGALVCS